MKKTGNINIYLLSLSGKENINSAYKGIVKINTFYVNAKSALFLDKFPNK